VGSTAAVWALILFAGCGQPAAPSPPTLDERIVALGRCAALGERTDPLLDPASHVPMRAAGGLDPRGWVVVSAGLDGQFQISPEAVWREAVSARAALLAGNPNARFDLRAWSSMKRGVEARFLDSCYDPTNGAASAGDRVWGEIEESPLFERWPPQSRARLSAWLASQDP
jgi:hypothetical protein